MKALARFRADPSKIRVSIRSDPAFPRQWLVFVEIRGTNRYVTQTGPNAENAILQAVALAAQCKWDGIDLRMENAYEHPFREADDREVDLRTKDFLLGRRHFPPSLL